MIQKRTDLEQAARDYADSEWIDSYESDDSFEQGVRWMLEQATKWLMNQGSRYNDGVVMISVEEFRQFMEGVKYIMKVNELMIGDWFSYNEVFHRVDALRSRLTWNLVGYTGDGNHHLWVTDKAVKPIKLTDDILTANGWDRTIYDSDHTLYYIGCVDDPDFTMEYVPEHGCFYFANARIEFVHELQHALRLYGFTDMADNINLL